MIFLSAGHSPYRKGASFGSFYEYDEAVVWVSTMANMLGTKAMVVPTGILSNKVSFINERCSEELDVAIEIHFNSALDRSGNHIGKGCETLYYPGSRRGIDIAEKIQESMARVFFPSRGIKEGWYRMDPSNGIDYFLAKTKCTSLILEPEFIHNKDLIVSNRELCCNFIAEALQEVL